MTLLAAATASASVPVWIALAAATIGAGGAVLAQIVTQLFTAQRDSRRFAWEKERKALEDHQAHYARLLDRRIAIYSEFTSMPSTWIDKCDATLVEVVQVRYRNIHEHVPNAERDCIERFEAALTSYEVSRSPLLQTMAIVADEEVSHAVRMLDIEMIKASRTIVAIRDVMWSERRPYDHTRAAVEAVISARNVHDSTMMTMRRSIAGKG